MKRFWFQITSGLSIAAAMFGLLFTIPAFVSAQVVGTETPIPGGPAPIVTNNYTEPVHVRSGPGSLYAQLGTLAIGDTAQALGVSPKHEWIQIVFSPSPDGTGWVYAPFVQLSAGYLRVLEPQPTITPLATGTVDPTLAAAFDVQPTETRLPTFTPPPPLTVPTFTNISVSPPGFPWGMLILVIALVGVFVLAISFFVRR